MAYDVTTDTSGPLRWPKRCARCGSKDELQSAAVSIGEVRGARLRLSGGVEIDTRMCQFSYPVCTLHARGMGLAALLNRQTSVMKGVRAVIYLFGVLGLPNVLLLPLRLLGKASASPSGAAMPLGAMLLMLACTVMMLMLVWARRHQPVQGIRLRNKALTLRFRNEIYGRAFERANR